MPYVLVILRGGANAEDEQLHAPAHERFISSPDQVARCLLVIHDVVRPECVLRKLVGVNPDAIDASAVG